MAIFLALTISGQGHGAGVSSWFVLVEWRRTDWDGEEVVVGLGDSGGPDAIHIGVERGWEFMGNLKKGRNELLYMFLSFFFKDIMHVVLGFVIFVCFGIDRCSGGTIKK